MRGKIFFNFGHMVGYALLAEEAAACGGDEHVVFDAHAAEILEFLDFVEAEELGIRALAPPKVDEVGDEVYARFVGDHMAYFQAAGKAQTGKAELGRGARLGIVAHVDLPETFHVVHVHAHGVSQSVGQEEGVRSGADGFFSKIADTVDGWLQAAVEYFR